MGEKERRILELLISGFTEQETAARLQQPLEYVRAIIRANGWQNARKRAADASQAGIDASSSSSSVTQASVGNALLESVAPATRHVFAYSSATGKYHNRSIEAADIQSGQFTSARISEASVVQHEGAISHNALSGYAVNQHRIWEQSLAQDIHADNISEASVTQHQNALAIPPSNITMARVGTPTYSSLQDLMNFVASPGRVDGGDISDAGAETVDVAAGTGFIKAVDSDISEVKFFDWPATTGIAVATDTTVYIGVEWNAGNPQVTSRAVNDFDIDTEFSLGQVTNQGGTLHIINNPWWTGDAVANIIERFQSEGTLVRDNRVGGLILGETGTRNVTLSGGTLWSRLTEFLISSIDTSGADSFTASYRDGSGGWTNTDGVSQWPNEQYDDGSGTLATMSNNHYANLWFYVETDGNLVMLYPQATYPNLTGAENEQPPSTIPDRVKETGILVGRILFIKSASSATDISSAFETVFATTGVTDHGSLSGLTDDDHPQYHTDARALTWLGTRSTTDLPEGSNLYYTDERVDDRVNALLQAGTDISLTYDDGANTLTIAYTGSGGSSTLSGLSDVTISSIASGEILKWNGSAWVNNTLTEAGIVPASGGTFTGDVNAGTFTAEYNAGTNQVKLKRSDGAEAGFLFLDSSNDLNIRTVSGGSSINLVYQDALSLFKGGVENFKFNTNGQLEFLRAGAGKLVFSGSGASSGILGDGSGNIRLYAGTSSSEVARLVSGGLVIGGDFALSGSEALRVAGDAQFDKNIYADNFSAGSSGWQIAYDGGWELGTGTMRGASTFRDDMIFNDGTNDSIGFRYTVSGGVCVTLYNFTDDVEIARFGHSINEFILTNHSTTGNAANTHLTTAGQIMRSTSSLRYKEDVVTLDDALISRRGYTSNSLSEMLSKFRPIRFRDRGDKTYHVGFAAEEVHQIMPELCTYDEQGRPDWVQYPHLTALLVGGWQKHEARLTSLQKEMISKYQENQDLIYKTRRELLDLIQAQEVRIAELESPLSR